MLTVKSNIRKFIKEEAFTRRGMKFTCVNGDLLAWYEQKLRRIILNDIESHPSTGKTFKESITRETSR